MARRDEVQGAVGVGIVEAGGQPLPEVVADLNVVAALGEIDLRAFEVGEAGEGVEAAGVVRVLEGRGGGVWSRVLAEGAERKQAGAAKEKEFSEQPLIVSRR
jgi:predicted aconitase with swiveling domain